MMDYQIKAKLAVAAVFNAQVEKTDEVELLLDDIYVVWFAKTLRNWKCLLSTNIPDGMYYEVTYDGAKEQMYVDCYKKWRNVCITDSEWHGETMPDLSGR